LSWFHTVGRPPPRPRARAAARPGHGALADELALELSQAGEHVEDQPPAGRAGVDLLGEADQGDAALFEVVYDVDQVPQRPSEPVQPPHHQAVPGSGALQRTRQTRTVLDRPGGMVYEDAVHSGPLKGVQLQGLVLGVGADPGVADLEGGVCRSRHSAPW